MADQISINKKTTISFGVVLIIISFAFSAGALYMKIQGLEDNFNIKIANIEEKIDILNSYFQPNIITLKPNNNLL